MIIKTMIFYKKETEKNELVANPGRYTHRQDTGDFMEKTYSRKLPLV